MKWISIKDRLPGTKYSCVLVWSNERGPEVAWFINCQEGYYFCIGKDVRQTWQPDFWMEFPKINKTIGMIDWSDRSYNKIN